MPSPRLLTILPLALAVLCCTPGASTASTITDQSAIPAHPRSVPDDAVWVAEEGDDAAPGTRNEPVHTIGRAVQLATQERSTIVLRAGSYYESLRIAKPVHLRSAPGEDAWIVGTMEIPPPGPGPDGTDTDLWSTLNGHYVLNWDWDPATSSPPPGAADPAAGLPEQVFVDGRPLRQVRTLAALTADSFYYDPQLGRYHFGAGITPATMKLEISALHSGITFVDGSQGSSVYGIGVAGFASLWGQGPNSAGMLINVSRGGTGSFTIDSSTFLYNGFAGLGVNNASGVRVANSKFIGNGNVGLRGRTTDGMVVEDSYFARNNLSYTQADGTDMPAWGRNEFIQHAGAKFGRARDMIVRRNVFTRNLANGLWFDVGVSNSRVYANRAESNRTHGIFYEVSTSGTIFSNMVVDNGEMGIKTTSNNTTIANNTSVGNGIALGIVEDDRRVGDGSCNSYAINAAADCDTYNIRAMNNILGETPGEFANVRVEGADPTRMLVAAERNLYQRSAPTVPSALVKWGTARYLSLAAFRAGTGLEADPISPNDLVGAHALGLLPDGKLATDSPARQAGQALPSDLAALRNELTGSATGAIDAGAVRWPASANFPIRMTGSDPVAPTPPVVQIHTPLAGATTTGHLAPTFTVTAAAGATIAHVELVIDGTVLDRDTTAPFSLEGSTEQLSDGSHTMVVRARDSRGTLGTARQTVLIANPPSAPANLTSTALRRAVSFTWSPSADADLAGYEVRVGVAGDVQAVREPGFRVGTKAGQTASLQVRSVDVAGNHSAWVTGSGSALANAAPTCAQPQPLQITSGGSVSLEVHCTDADGDSVEMSYATVSKDLNASVRHLSADRHAVQVNARPGALGAATFELTASDGDAAVRMTIPVTIIPVRLDAKLSTSCQTVVLRRCVVSREAKLTATLGFSGTASGKLPYRVILRQRAHGRWITARRFDIVVDLSSTTTHVEIGQLPAGEWNVQIHPIGRTPWIRRGGALLRLQVDGQSDSVVRAAWRPRTVNAAS